jgi:hypothetical protein
MARDRANLRLDMWGDSHWRSLSHGAQWLYEHLLSSPTLNSCGVADWRPVRIAAMSADVTTEHVEQWGRELESEFFVVIDRDTEEAAIRSFFRHDGILAQPNPTKGAAREFGSIASGRIQGVISYELNRLREEFPEGFGKSNVWVLDELRTLLKTTPIDVRNPSLNPSNNPSGNPFDTSTSTSTPTEASLPGALDDGKRGREVAIPKDWAPTTEHFELARARGVDIAAEADAFRLHAETHDRRAVRWNAAFTSWLKKARPRPQVGYDPDAWMNAS